MKRLFVDDEGYPRPWWLYVSMALAIGGLLVVMIAQIARAHADPPPPDPTNPACGIGTFYDPGSNTCQVLPNPVTNPVPPGYYPADNYQPCNSWYFSLWGISAGSSCGGWGGGYYGGGYGYYGGYPGWGGWGWPGFGHRPGWG